MPGIEPSNDKMLQARLFSYPDTHRHRLGPNYDQIPINCPYAARVKNYQRDGLMNVNGNQGSGPNYEPNSLNGPVEAPEFALSKQSVNGQVGRFSNADHPNDDFEQPRNFYNKVLNEEGRANLTANIAGHMKGVRRDIQERQLKIFYKCDPDYGTRIAKLLNLPVPAKL